MSATTTRTTANHPGTTRGKRRTTAFVAALAVAVTLILAACGQTPAISLSLDASSADLLRGGSVQIDVTLTRLGGASADVALAVTGLPANVAATFAPPTLSGGTLTSTLTLKATAAAVEGDSYLTVTGTGTGLSATAPLTLDVASLTVTGRVVTLFEVPVAGVVVDSQDDTDVTDANGEFTLSGLSVPYDVSVWNAAAEWVHVYEGLTATELRLAPLPSAGFPAFPRTASISGTFTGGVTPASADHPVIVCAEGLDSVVLGCISITSGDSYTFSPEWTGPASRQVRLHALQIELDSASQPVSYPGYATMTVTLNDGVAVTEADLDLGSALTTTTVDVVVDSPIAISGVLAAVHLGPNLELPVASVTSAATEYQFVMPVIDGVNYGFVTLASGTQAGWVSDVTGPTATLKLADLPARVSPTDAAVNVTNTTVFKAVNPTDGPMTFMWRIIGGPTVSLTTMATSHAMPDLADYGLTLPPGAPGVWQVVGSSGPSSEYGTAAFVDFFNAFYMLLAGASPGTNGSGTFGITDEWNFTVAP